ncbi:Clathrin light chain [Coemansia guatemalensis]|uniref:Clathrin light chain n=1 Tax=Coemansia guatemalensis TaxID=2761395 RepID=A0A9W8I391_9FUNG|nr:Clathrin light chain [Coemansia guatemalensis]
MSDDPMADFLARERAALGQDADLFQSGAADDASSAVVPDSEPANTGDASAFMPALEAEDRTEFVSPTPSNGPVFSAASPQSANAQSPSTSAAGGTEFEREWQSKQQEAIAERDRVAEEKHKDIVEEARNAIDKFYEEYNKKKDEAIEENRANQEIESQAANRGNLWERAVRQIDMATKASSSSAAGTASPRGDLGTPARVASPAPSASRQHQQQQQQQQQTVRDTSRMRDLLHDLKRDPDAPGLKSKATASATS